MSAPEAKDEWYSGDTTRYDVQLVHKQKDRLRPVITVISGLQVGKTTVLNSPRTIIGRDAEAELSLIDTGISRQHAALQLQTDGKVIIEDLESTNGVHLNGKQVTHAVLETGDKLQLGPETVLKFGMEDPDEVEARVQQYERSIRDDLTGIYNRRYFTVTLERELSYIRRRDTISSLVMLDVDHFKRVNDEFGHGGGDKVLELLTRTVSAYIREEDVFARWGGEEFVLLLRGMDRAGACNVAERIRSQLESLPLHCSGSSFNVTASFGVVSIDLNRHDSVEAAMHEVDEYLYKAKRNGRNCVMA